MSCAQRWCHHKAHLQLTPREALRALLRDLVDDGVEAVEAVQLDQVGQLQRTPDFIVCNFKG